MGVGVGLAAVVAGAVLRLSDAGVAGSQAGLGAAIDHRSGTNLALLTWTWGI